LPCKGLPTPIWSPEISALTMPLNESEVHWQIVHGKPYEGKLHVRFDEGSPETGWQVTTALVTYSTTVTIPGQNEGLGIPDPPSFPLWFLI
jgi:hypothetical protein